MRSLLFIMAALIVLTTAPALGQTGQLSPDPSLLPPYKDNAYGPGINSDATGRPFIWQPHPPQVGPAMPDPTLNVRPDAYGPGIGADQYGRPVTGQSWPRN